MIGINCFICRKFMELPQESVAKTVGISVEKYRLIEKGELEPEPEVAERLAKVFNVTVNDLNYGIFGDKRFGFFQKPLSSFFESPEEMQRIERYITELTDDEKSLIIMYRLIEHKTKAFDALRELLYDE